MKNQEPDDSKRQCRTGERRAQRPDRIDPVQLYSVEETCAALDVSRAALYQLFTKGDIRSVDQLTRRRRVAGAEIMRYVASLQS